MSHRTAGAEGRPGSPDRRTTGTWVTAGVLLALGIVVPLLVPLYDQEDPSLWGFPFYYWFQFLLIPIVSVMTFVAFRLSLRATREDRPRFGLAPEPPSTDAPSGSGTGEGER
jgi:hypothetical protein